MASCSFAAFSCLGHPKNGNERIHNVSALVPNRYLDKRWLEEAGIEICTDCTSHINRQFHGDGTPKTQMKLAIADHRLLVRGCTISFAATRHFLMDWWPFFADRTELLQNPESPVLLRRLIVAAALLRKIPPPLTAARGISWSSLTEGEVKFMARLRGNKQTELAVTGGTKATVKLVEDINPPREILMQPNGKVRVSLRAPRCGLGIFIFSTIFSRLHYVPPCVPPCTASPQRTRAP